MRKVVFGVANSLDNFIARPDHAVDWLRWGPEVAAFISAFWKTIDTVVMGRKTYTVAQKFGQGGGYPGVKSYVFSRTLRQNADAVTIVPTDAAPFIRRLKRKPGKDICVMGGGALAASLLEAGVVDEIGFNIHPVLLGSGIPLFHPMKRQVDLELIEARRFKNGCVLVRYTVLPPSRARPRPPARRKSASGRKGRRSSRSRP